jgi:Flp pilus assembly protein TadG
VTGFHHDRRGAAMVEFIVILVPLMTLFLAMLELSRLAIAHLLLERAAGMAVRACAVTKDQPANCDGGNAEADRLIELAASRGTNPWTETNLMLDSVECRTQKPSGRDTVQIQGRFRCVVPIARNILCSTPRPATLTTEPISTRPVAATASYGHQGAGYDCRYANMQYALPGVSGQLDLPTLGGAWP